MGSKSFFIGIVGFLILHPPMAMAADYMPKSFYVFLRKDTTEEQYIRIITNRVNEARKGSDLMVKHIMGRLDFNHDGKATLSEMQEEGKKAVQAGLETEEEIAESIKQTMQVFDRNKDNVIEPAEIGPMPQILSDMDSNRDGVVSEDEIHRGAKAAFKIMDLDRNGILDEKEREANETALKAVSRKLTSSREGLGSP